MEADLRRIAFQNRVLPIMKSRILLSLAALVCSFLASCAGGQTYSDVKSTGALTPRNGNGMVLIYRTSGMVSAAYKPYLYADQVLLPARLARGGFYSYEAKPGPLSLAYSKVLGESTPETRAKARVTNMVGGAIVAGPLGAVLGAAIAGGADIDSRRRVALNITVLPGQTHYVYMGGAGGDLQVATPEEAEEDIEDCHWLNPPNR